MSKGFAETICRRVDRFKEYCRKPKAIVGSALPCWDPVSNNFIHNLATKSKFFEKPTLDNIRFSLKKMRGHFLFNNITQSTMPETGCRLDKLKGINVFKLIQDTFT